MIAEFLVTLICIGLCCTNVYVISIFVVHRHHLTAKTLLQSNLAFCNLLASYYLTAATFEEALYGADSFCKEDEDTRSTGWNMTLCSLSASSWALTIVLWFHANQRRLDSLRREVTINVTYGFIGATWLYFTVLVLTHMLGIYGWTFDSHDSADIKSWMIFVMVPFLLPWLMQAWIFFEINPAGFFDGIKGLFIERKSSKKDPVALDSKDEMVIIESKGEEDQRDKPLPPDEPSTSDSMEQILSLATSLFICGVVSVLLALLATRILSSANTEELLPKFFIALVCVTWINCSVSPFILFSGETEVESSRRYVDTVIRAVSRSVYSYLKLYVPDSGLVAQCVRRVGGMRGRDERKESGEDVVQVSEKVPDSEAGEVC